MTVYLIKETWTSNSTAHIESGVNLTDSFYFQDGRLLTCSHPAMSTSAPLTGPNCTVKSRGMTQISWV